MLFLIQHGEANDANIDPERDLTPLGERHARGAGRFLALHRAVVERILHSGKLRAERTARVLAAELGAADKVAYRAGLLPGDDPRAMIAEIQALTPEGLVIVGHLPFLQRLAEELLGCSVVRFQNAGIVALEEHPEGWVVKWAVVPELFDEEPRK